MFISSDRPTWVRSSRIANGIDVEKVVHFTLSSTVLPCSVQFQQSLYVKEKLAESGNYIIGPMLRFC